MISGPVLHAGDGITIDGSSDCRLPRKVVANSPYPVTPLVAAVSPNY